VTPTSQGQPLVSLTGQGKLPINQAWSSLVQHGVWHTHGGIPLRHPWGCQTTGTFSDTNKHYPMGRGGIKNVFWNSIQRIMLTQVSITGMWIHKN